MFFSSDYEEIESLLKNKDLFEKNKTMIGKLKDYPDWNCFEILGVLKVLDKNNLLDQKSLTRFGFWPK